CGTAHGVSLFVSEFFLVERRVFSGICQGFRGQDARRLILNSRIRLGGWSVRWSSGQRADRGEAMKDSGENGIALVAVLWLLILLAVVAAALSFETHSNARVARNMSENASARMAADAGIQRAILDLQAAVRAPGDAGQLRVDGTVYTWRFAECTVRLS